MSDIMSISRLRMGTDGQGITTLIGFYGCPLDCKYCGNKQCHDSSTPRADYSAEELSTLLSIDEMYFLMTSGGVTFGGGEPLLQADFIHELCEIMPKKWRRTMETSLYSPWEKIDLIVSDIDYWIVDVKDVNDDIYKAYTGKSNSIVLDNLKRLVDMAGPDKVLVRLPIIPKYNDLSDRGKSEDYIWSTVHPDIKVDHFEYLRI